MKKLSRALIVLVAVELLSAGAVKAAYPSIKSGFASFYLHSIEYVADHA